MIKFFFAGDYFNPTGNTNIVCDNLKKIISNCDYSICNFEAPINSLGTKINKSGPHITQPYEALSELKRIGFNCISIANNHIYDFGSIGLQQTISSLQKEKILYVGAGLNFESAYKPLRIEHNNISVSILAGCESEFGCMTSNKTKGGYAWINSKTIEENIIYARKTSDIVIVIAHAGIEEIEIPLPEWRERFKLFCELGADVVIGHHPHVPQGIEKHLNSTIFYSLGNFYFDNVNSPSSTDDSYSVILNLEKVGVINYEIIYHSKQKGVLTLTDDKNLSFNLNKLNSLLNENYNKEVSRIAKHLYENRYKAYYEAIFCWYTSKESIFNKVKSIIKNIVLNKKYTKSKELLLLHNLRIESHRYIVLRYLIDKYESLYE